RSHGCAGDPDGLGGNGVGFRGGEDARAREPPAAVDEDADPEALAPARRDALDAAVLDRDRLPEALNDADVGVARPRCDGGIKGTLAQFAHGGEGYQRPGRRVVGVFSLFRPRARSQSTGRPATADQVRTTPRPSTATEASRGAADASRPRLERRGIRSSRLRAN